MIRSKSYSYSCSSILIKHSIFLIFLGDKINRFIQFLEALDKKIVKDAKNNNKWFELFSNQIQDYFNNLLENGREVKLQIKVFKDWGKNLDTDFQNKTLNEIIEEWLQANTVKSKFNISSYTENLMILEEVKIPVLDNKNRGVDSRSFLRNLQKSL